MRPFRRTESGLLPREAAGETWLAAVIAVLCFLAALSAVGALAADRAARGWIGQLRTEATVQVRPSVGESPMTAAGRAAETLSGVDGVAEALSVPTADLRLFGKPEAFERRRMGVALARGETTDQARERATLAASLVRPVRG